MLQLLMPEGPFFRDSAFNSFSTQMLPFENRTDRSDSKTGFVHKREARMKPEPQGGRESSCLSPGKEN